MDLFEMIQDAVIFPSSDLTKVITIGIFPAAAALITLLLLYIGISMGSLAGIGVTAIIGGILSLIAFLFVGGYAFRTIQSTIAGSNELPDLED
ncbi:MAG: hypothetical protein HZC47_02670 [Methanobacterium sp.]|uniref:hypothetical protein n=1 Tax=Methanobacterium sp. TaxID=2164 RepID=UPI003D65044B|nr:hypothetical protein [Methanobacterium sp.]